MTDLADEEVAVNLAKAWRERWWRRGGEEGEREERICSRGTVGRGAVRKTENTLSLV